MKKLNKVLAVGLSLVMCAGMVAPAFAASYCINDGSVTISNRDDSVWVKHGNNAEVKDEDVIIVYGNGETTTNTITVTGDAEVTLKDVDIDVSNKSQAAMSVGANSNVTVELDGTNSLTSGSGHAGLELNNDDKRGNPQKDVNGGSVIIKDDDNNGSLTATGGYNGAGVGSGYRDIAGDITIDGADVTANGGSGSAGIGSGSRGTTGNITIDGADVTATGGDSGAGIGSGQFGTAGNITIDGADVTATGGDSGAGIGTGWNGTAGDITIENSADVEANGGSNSAGIGSSSGYSSAVKDINITESTVNATGGYVGAGIGTGSNSTAKDINITKSNVTANGGEQAGAGIGTGFGGTLDNITIKGGNITAKADPLRSSGGAPGIGGFKVTGDIKLENLDSLLALGGGGYYGIQKGSNGTIPNPGGAISAPEYEKQGILNGKFLGNVLTGAKKATVQIMDANGTVWDTVEMTPDHGGMWSGLAVLLPEGTYYVYVTTNDNSEGVFVAQTGNGGNIAYKVTDDNVLSKPFDNIAKYEVRYGFASGTEGMELPDEVLPAPPTTAAGQKLTKDTLVNGVSCAKEYGDVEVEGGTWHFSGWSTEPILSPITNGLAYIEEGGAKYVVQLVGTWTFEADSTEPEPTDPPEPTNPPEPIDPTDPTDPGTEIEDPDVPLGEEPDDEVEIEDPRVPLAGPFTRADAIGYLWEQTGSPDAELSDFPDVPEDHYWAVAIGWAQDMGIALPDEEGNFRPDDLVLRSSSEPEGELQQFLNRYAVFAGAAEQGESFIQLTGASDDIIMGEEAQVIFDEFFAKLEAALTRKAA